VSKIRFREGSEDMITTTRKRQRGFTLSEAVVAFGITATGLLAVASFQGDLITDSAYNKARSEALALAEQKIEEFKHYTLADEDTYIDDDGDGVMDPDGNYSDPAIDGQNAVFTRSWDLDTGNDGRAVDVTVTWTDSNNVDQSVALSASIPWKSPRGGADQVLDASMPLLPSPAGRAELGEGELADYPSVDANNPIYTDPDDGLRTFQNDQNLLLVDQNDRVLLTLLDVCISAGSCTDFVKISGTVYLDKANVPGSVKLKDIYVISSDAAHCQRWVPTGTMANPPTTASGDYEYYNYTCYLGGGWYGNIGFLKDGGIQQSDKVCQGDPTSLNAWESTVIALRRAYRGMVHYTSGGQTFYESQGIKDAAVITDQDFVFSRLDASYTAGGYCKGLGAPMTRTDSNSGTLFAGTPTDFVCLNADDNLDGLPDYLDSYDSSVYSANTYCPFDPTDPPVQAHSISGAITVTGGPLTDLSGIEVVTSDGSNDCSVTGFTSLINLLDPTNVIYSGTYSCNVYDWGTGWSGYVQLNANSNQLYCDDSIVQYDGMSSDQTLNFGCEETDTVTYEGLISYTDNTDPVTGIAITDVGTSTPGFCAVVGDRYRCLLPYSGTSVDVQLEVGSVDVVCGSASGVYSFTAATAGASPYRQEVYVAELSNQCP
jgi:Tfp pilus assembly protein PilV